MLRWCSEVKRGRRAAMKLLLLVVITFGIAISEARHIGSHLRNGEQEEGTCSLRDPIMSPIYEVRLERDVVYQLPRNPKGILVIIHGYSLNPFSFFDKSPDCEECYGLPEDRSIVLEALRRGYAVIAPKSEDSNFDDASLDDSRDLRNVIDIINDIRIENSVPRSVPFVIFGSSSGGPFATILATTIPTAALLLMNSRGKPTLVVHATRQSFPPTFFVYMNTTNEETGNLSLPLTRPAEAPVIATRADVERSMAILSENGVLVGGILCLPKPVVPLYFTERLRCTTAEMSAKLQKAYKAADWLDDDDYLTVVPSTMDWLAPLPKSSWPYWYVPGVECKVDALCEELRRAEGVHVVTGDGNQAMYDWLDSLPLTSSNDDDQLLHSNSR